MKYDPKPQTMDEFRVLLSDTSKTIYEIHKLINEWKDDIIIAFIAKYGMQPDEVVIHHKGGSFLFVKKMNRIIFNEDV